MKPETLKFLITSIIIATLIACLIKVLNFLWFTPKRLEKILKKQGLRGNPYRFLVGDLRDFTRVAKQEQTRTIELDDDLPPHVLPYFYQSQKRHGKNSYVWFGPKPTVNIVEPEILKEILSRPEIFHKLHPEPVGEAIIGGLLVLDGEKWAKHRRIVNPTFRMEKLKNMVPEICLSCLNMMEAWDARVSCNAESYEEFNVWPYVENMSGDVISRTAFGSNFEEGRRVFELQSEQVKLVLDLLPFIFIPGWRHVPTKANRRLKALEREIRSLLRSIINRRKEAMERGENAKADLLSTLMESNSREIEENGNRKSKGMSIEEVIEECKLFYFAGSETTSGLMLWTMVMLRKHQEWQRRAREEVMQVFGHEQPTFNGLNRLKILNMIFLEVLRLYSPVSLSSRSPTKTVKLGNITIPKGADFMLLIGMLHYDKEIWGDDAHKFRPERFSNGISGAVKNPYSYIPFGAGPRICIGQNLAMIEAKVALTMMLQRFSFELGQSYVHAPFLIITLRPEKGASLILRKLHS